MTTTTRIIATHAVAGNPKATGVALASCAILANGKTKATSRTTPIAISIAFETKPFLVFIR